MLPLDNCPNCVVSFGENLIRIDSVSSISFGYSGDEVPDMIRYFIDVEYEFGKYTIHTGSKDDMYHFLLQLQKINYISGDSIPNINDFTEKLRNVWLQIKHAKGMTDKTQTKSGNSAESSDHMVMKTDVISNAILNTCKGKEAKKPSKARSKGIRKANKLNDIDASVNKG